MHEAPNLSDEQREALLWVERAFGPRPDCDSLASLFPLGLVVSDGDRLILTKSGHQLYEELIKPSPALRN